MIFLKFVCIKSKNDERSFNVFKTFGTKIYELEDLEQVDNKIKECIEQQYNPIIISNEVANFSGDIITKYQNSNLVHIIIASDRRT